jgi:hypothetical protein
MKKSNINILKIWIKSQPTLQDVPNREQQQKKVKEGTKKQVETVDYDEYYYL